MSKERKKERPVRPLFKKEKRIEEQNKDRKKETLCMDVGSNGM